MMISSIIVGFLILGFVRLDQAESASERVSLSGNSVFHHEPRDSNAHRRTKRMAQPLDLTPIEIEQYLFKHNQLRGMVVPQATNMEFLVWDDTLATMAQQWSNNCSFNHGFPEENISPFDRIGQNLYAVGPVFPDFRANPFGVVQSWFNEDRFYTYENKTCRSKKVCGHYTQVVWAESYALGCAMTMCDTLESFSKPHSIIVTCNYGPNGNIANTLPYLSGPPCTQCSSSIGQCYNNTCRLCSTHNEECVCKQVCYNGGILNSTTCSCECRGGPFGPDCSIPCVNVSPKCLTRWPAFYCLNPDPGYNVVRERCPDMCGLCSEGDPITEPPVITTTSAADPPTSESANGVIITTSATNASTTEAVICINGVVQGSTCKCSPGYQGETCTKERVQARNGVVIVFQADIAAWNDIWEFYGPYAASYVTLVCNRMFEPCCPGKGTRLQNDMMLPYVNESHMLVATGYPEVEQGDDGRFTIMVLVTVPDTSVLCQNGSASSSLRKRRDVPLNARLSNDGGQLRSKRALNQVSYLDQGVLLEAVRDSTVNLTSDIKAMLGLNVSAVIVKAGQEELIATEVPSASPGDAGLSGGIIAAIVISVIAVAVTSAGVAVVVYKKIISNDPKVEPSIAGEADELQGTNISKDVAEVGRWVKSADTVT